ncbi:ribosomal maturation YjgA family protein [Tellurirhabdus rosea]|uniref:ribosomal maturation YjgA family protein n=1 Tax=Tellurirhabdus rosea TaxID=2674997 RepID=UPI0022575F5E|nr:DUF2809 domain-containing protein [Tellurirhabdus rosea]
MFRFHLPSFLLAIALFITEVLIAAYVHDRFVRPYFGDFLVVFLVYYAVKSILETSVNKLAFGVLLFAFFVEALQYVNFIAWAGLEHNRLAKIVLGTNFEWIDILAYSLGVAAILLIEKSYSRSRKKTYDQKIG